MNKLELIEKLLKITKRAYHHTDINFSEFKELEEGLTDLKEEYTEK